MKTIILGILSFVVTNTFAQTTTILLYQNDFESPKITPMETPAEVYRDLDSRLVDDIYSGTGTGTSSSVYFKQTWTVETILIKGPAGVYEASLH